MIFDVVINRIILRYHELCFYLKTLFRFWIEALKIKLVYLQSKIKSSKITRISFILQIYFLSRIRKTSCGFVNVSHPLQFRCSKLDAKESREIRKKSRTCHKSWHLDIYSRNISVYRHSVNDAWNFTLRDVYIFSICKYWVSVLYSTLYYSFICTSSPQNRRKLSAVPFIAYNNQRVNNNIVRLYLQVILRFFMMANGAIYATTNGMWTKLEWSAGNWVSLDTRKLRTAAGLVLQDVRIHIYFAFAYSSFAHSLT